MVRTFILGTLNGEDSTSKAMSEYFAAKSVHHETNYRDLFGLANSEQFIVVNPEQDYDMTDQIIMASGSARKEKFSVVIISPYPDYERINASGEHVAGYVKKIEKMENVDKIYLLGVTPEGLAASVPESDIDYPILRSPKVEIYLSNPLEKLLEPETASGYYEHYLLMSAYNALKDSDSCRMLHEFDPSKIDSKDVYLSANMNTVSGLGTRWKIGEINFKELMNLTRDIADKRYISGANISAFNFAVDPTDKVHLDELYVYYNLLKSKMDQQNIEVRPVELPRNYEGPGARDINVTA